MIYYHYYLHDPPPSLFRRCVNSGTNGLAYFLLQRQRRSPKVLKHWHHHSVVSCVKVAADDIESAVASRVVANVV
jgi:hypothetical protein